MNENLEQNNNIRKKIETPEDQERKDNERLKAYLAEHPEIIPPKEKKSYKKEFQEKMETMFSDFEAEFSLDELSAITTEEEARKSLLRESAKKALVPLHKLFNEIRDTTDISSEDFDTIEQRRKRISMAVGLINSGMLRHE